jgi:hypothetical protein
VIGVTDEAVELVDEFVARYKPTFPIAITGNKGFDDALGVKGFPTHAVIDPDGTLAYAGYSAESALSDALGGASKGSIFPKKLDKASKLIKQGSFALSYAEVRKLVDAGGLDDELDLWAKRFQTFLEGRSATAVAEAKKLMEKGRIFEAHAEVKGYADAAPAFPNAEDVKKLLAELEAIPTFADEMKAGPKYLEAQALEREHDYSGAVDAYKKLYKKYGETKIAAAARARAEELIAEGMPGFQAACETCGKAKRACAKHKEAVKL